MCTSCHSFQASCRLMSTFFLLIEKSSPPRAHSRREATRKMRGGGREGGRGTMTIFAWAVMAWALLDVWAKDTVSAVAARERDAASVAPPSVGVGFGYWGSAAAGSAAHGAPEADCPQLRELAANESAQLRDCCLPEHGAAACPLGQALVCYDPHAYDDEYELQSPAAVVPTSALIALGGCSSARFGLPSVPIAPPWFSSFMPPGVWGQKGAALVQGGAAALVSTQDSAAVGTSFGVDRRAGWPAKALRFGPKGLSPLKRALPFSRALIRMCCAWACFLTHSQWQEPISGTGRRGFTWQRRRPGGSFWSPCPSNPHASATAWGKERLTGFCFGGGVRGLWGLEQGEADPSFGKIVMVGGQARALIRR